MEAIQTSNRLHPLVAGAAASVTLVCLLGAAAITGILPSSHGTVAPAANISPSPVLAATAPAVQAPAPAVVPASEYAEPRHVVHHSHVVHHAEVAQAQPAQYSQPVYQQPAPVAHNSPVGIGVGAVVGGIVGSQVGGGNGRTLATIAGAIGGGYLGNEIAKRNQ